ncbi:MAG: type II secretion system F family protein [Anaerolineae bacterium]|nr:type II secretion system F family protein [Anaerolineae bacterium]
MELIQIVQITLGIGFVAVVIGMVLVGRRVDTGVDPLEDRLGRLVGEDEIIESLSDVEMKLSFAERVIVPIIEMMSDGVGRFTPQKQLEDSRRLIEMAGQSTDPTQFFLMRIGATIGLGVMGLMMALFAIEASPVKLLMWTGGGILLGYMLPVLLLKSKISRRQSEIQKALPDALDLLVICVEAGLGFDAAMGKIYEKWDNELALAFGRVLREIQLGKIRRDALKAMADRMDVPDVSAFIAAIIQAEQLGVSMSKILRVQSDQMRVKRRQRAQEKAQQAPVKMMIPMVLLIFPSLWVVLMGPAIIQVMSTDSGGAF